MGLRKVMSGAFGYEHVPGRIQALWSARVGSLIRVLGLSGAGLWCPGNETSNDEVKGADDPSLNSDSNDGKTVHSGLGCDHRK